MTEDVVYKMNELKKSILKAGTLLGGGIYKDNQKWAIEIEKIIEQVERELPSDDEKDFLTGSQGLKREE